MTEHDHGAEAGAARSARLAGPHQLATITDAVADKLAAVDPEHAADYRANADALTRRAERTGRGVRGRPDDCQRTRVHHHPRRLRLPGQALRPDPDRHQRPEPGRRAVAGPDRRRSSRRPASTRSPRSSTRPWSPPPWPTSIAGDLGLRTDVLDPIEGITATSRAARTTLRSCRPTSRRCRRPTDAAIAVTGVGRAAAAVLDGRGPVRRARRPAGAARGRHHGARRARRSPCSAATARASRRWSAPCSAWCRSSAARIRLFGTELRAVPAAGHGSATCRSAPPRTQRRPRSRRSSPPAGWPCADPFVPARRRDRAAVPEALDHGRPARLAPLRRPRASPAASSSGC